MLNVIFLDVDGELTYSDYENKETANIDIEKVKILKQIAYENEAVIVISSSWRGTGNYIPNIYYVLLKILNENGLTVLGNCPNLPCKFNEEPPKNFYVGAESDLTLKYGYGRAAEVSKFIKENNVDTFLILDDEDWQWSDYDLEDKWIQPTWYGNGGLQQEHIEQAKKIFDKQKIRKEF